MDKLESDALDVVLAGIRSVTPEVLFARRCHRNGPRWSVAELEVDLDAYQNIWVIGAGKASAAMAQETEVQLGEAIAGGVVVTKYGHSRACQRIAIREAGHPLPDQNSLVATAEILALAQGAQKNDLVINLISGGGSSLLESLAPGITLHALQEVTRLLLRGGASIGEINTVRKHFSRVKGGQLARAIFPASCLSLIISDVIGDRLDMIASGPTVGDPTTFADALAVLNRYGLSSEMPPEIIAHLEAGISGTVPDTAKPGDAALSKVQNVILANNHEAIRAAAARAAELGYDVSVTAEAIKGDARDVGRRLAGELSQAARLTSRPICRIAGGETTVRVTGDGLGGRCQELAVAALATLAQWDRPYAIAACGTDGTDGPTDAAGGMASPRVWQNAEVKQLDIADYQSRNDTYHFLTESAGLIQTGPTGTNVCDIVVALAR